MTNNPATVPINDLNLQVNFLLQVTSHTCDVLKGSGVPGSDQAMEGLERILSNLNRLSKTIAQHEEERNNLRALGDIGQVVNSSLDLSEVLRIVMDTIIRLTGAERGFLMLHKDGLNCGDLVTVIARNWEQESLNAPEYAVSRTVINRVVSEGQAVLTTNAQEDPRFGSQESIITHNLRSILCVPLKVKGILIGVIYTDNRIRTGIFKESQRKLLSAFADQAAVAIENARLFASVRRSLAEVTELKNLMDNVFASIASGVITADTQNQVTLCNLAAESILGRNTSELIGRGLDEILPPIAPDLVRQVDSVRKTEQQLVGLEYNPTLPERGPVYLSLNLSPLKDASQSTQGVAIVLDDLTEKKRLEAQQRLFSRMVSPAVIDQLDPDELHLGGKRAVITTMFADVRGFTSFSERVDPETLVTVLNCYLAAAAEAILAQEGTIDKFLGDAIMAWFNAPILQPDHTLRAVQAALQIREAVQGLECRFPLEYQLNFGVGIHTGEAVLGLVGTEERLEYTAIGDSVNIAKRIQENTVAGQILISRAAYAQIAESVLVRAVEPIHAKGKSQPVEVYEILSLR